MKCKYRNLPPPPLFVSILVEFICLTGMCTLVKICQKDRKQLKTEYSTCTTPTFLIVNTGIQKINSKNNLQFHLSVNQKFTICQTPRQPSFSFFKLQ